nr:movement protein -like ORF2a [Armillaria bunya-like virus 1]
MLSLFRSTKHSNIQDKSANVEERRQMDRLNPTSPLSAFRFPNKTDTLEDLLSKHREGVFEYVTITTKRTESKKDIMNRLLEGLGKARREKLIVPEIEVAVLSKKVTDFNLANVLLQSKISSEGVIPTKKESAEEIAQKNLKEFILLDSIFVDFDGCASYTDEFSKVHLQIIDDRYLVTQVVRDAVVNSNEGSSHVLSLDYAVHRSDIRYLTFRIEIENSPFKEGVKYGSALFSISLSQQDTAQAVDLLPTMSTARTVASKLARHRRNPKVLDISHGQQGLEMMQEKFAKGQIIDRSRSVSKQGLDYSKLAGSAAGSDLLERDEDFGSDVQVAPIRKSNVKDLGAWRQGVPDSVPTGDESDKGEGGSNWLNEKVAELIESGAKLEDKGQKKEDPVVEGAIGVEVTPSLKGKEVVPLRSALKNPIVREPVDLPRARFEENA